MLAVNVFKVAFAILLKLTLSVEDCHCINPLAPARVNAVELAPIHTALFPEIVPPSDSSLTKALTLIVLELAFVLVIEMVPVIVPVDVLVERTKIVVFETVPVVGVKFIVLENPDEATVEISKPAGAVKLIFEVKYCPFTVNDCVADGVLIQACN